MTRYLSAERHPYRHDVSEDTQRLVIFLQTTKSGQSQMKGGVAVELKRRKEAKECFISGSLLGLICPLSSPTDFLQTAAAKLTPVRVHHNSGGYGHRK